MSSTASSASASNIALSTYTFHLDSRSRCRLLDIYRWNARFLDALHVTVFDNLDPSSDPTFAFDFTSSECGNGSQVLSQKRHVLVNHLSTTACGRNHTVDEDAEGRDRYLRIGGHLYPQYCAVPIRMIHILVQMIGEARIDCKPQEISQYRDLSDPAVAFLSNLTLCLIHSGVTGAGKRYITDYVERPNHGIRFGTTSSTFAASGTIFLRRHDCRNAGSSSVHPGCAILTLIRPYDRKKSNVFAPPKTDDFSKEAGCIIALAQQDIHCELEVLRRRSCQPYIITIRPEHTVAIVTAVVTGDCLEAVDAGDLAPEMLLQLHVSRIFDLKVVEDRDRFVRAYFDLTMHLIKRRMLEDSDEKE
ncbi:hypothetical protein BDD12DRAFT_900621 [Trichophaea hybrida]|nr:hypothetical protein BDD12DRAFT_900621 [Trichophaea hybrida]